MKIHKGEPDNKELFGNFDVECEFKPNPSFISKASECADLFGFSAIHVSVGFNKNDQYFTSEELWKAKFNSQHKRLDYEHNEKIIIGHLVDSYPVDSDLSRLDPDDEALVSKLAHIVTYGVIYKVWEDKAILTLVGKLMKEIPDGLWKVSMECINLDFDYLIVGRDGEKKFITRTPETSYLTKFLRKGGGSGVYNGDRIYQVPKDIMFVGQGIVKKPANPPSIILTYDKSANLPQGEVIMAEEIVITEIPADAEVAKAAESLAIASDVVPVEKSSVVVEQAATEPTLSAAEVELATLKAALETVKVEIAKANEVATAGKTGYEEAMTKCAALEAELSASKAAYEKMSMDKAGLETQLAAYSKAAKMESRKAALMKAGVPEVAVADMLYPDMEDEPWAVIRSSLEKYIASVFKPATSVASAADVPAGFTPPPANPPFPENPRRTLPNEHSSDIATASVEEHLDKVKTPEVPALSVASVSNNSDEDSPVNVIRSILKKAEKT